MITRIPSGCNSSFITLIPKINNSVVISDFHIISLIGIQYKVFAKLLALRWPKVIHLVVSGEQTRFIKNRKIFNGPLMVNEVVEWYKKKKKKKMMLLKIDFGKSVRWSYLDCLMKFMNFGDKLCAWIRACLILAKLLVLVNGSPIDEFQSFRGILQEILCLFFYSS